MVNKGTDPHHRGRGLHGRSEGWREDGVPVRTEPGPGGPTIKPRPRWGRARDWDAV